jgi:hypothetical protein
MMHLR